MATTISLFNHTRELVFNGAVDLDNDVLKVALILSTYTFNAAHQNFSDVSAHELAAGGGYTAGGKTLTGAAVTRISTSLAKFTADNPVWAALTATFRYGLLYDDTVSIAGYTKPPLALVLLDDTPANVSVANADYALQWAAAGIFTLN